MEYRTNGSMRCVQNRSYLVVALLGMFLVGCICMVFTSSCLSLNKQLEVVKCYTSATLNHDKDMALDSPEGHLYKQPSLLNGRKDVIPMTPWLAPVIWDQTFDPTVIDGIYKQQNITIATTVFALGKYVRFLKDLLESAEQHYMLGYRVHYYVFTDQPEAVPAITLGPKHHLTLLKIQSSNRWQEISLRRMEILENLIESHLATKVDYMFCLDVDTKFYGHWGAESLGSLVGVIHAGYYSTQRDWFPYERRPESRAYIPKGEGDYYYSAAVFGGRVSEVHKLVKACRINLGIDAANSIEAAWQEESHLNRYFLYHKPTKVLSSEYLWQDFKAKTNEIKIVRFSQIIKNYAEIRPNP